MENHTRYSDYKIEMTDGHNTVLIGHAYDCTEAAARSHITLSVPHTYTLRVTLLKDNKEV